MLEHSTHYSRDRTYWNASSLIARVCLVRFRQQFFNSSWIQTQILPQHKDQRSVSGRKASLQAIAQARSPFDNRRIQKVLKRTETTGVLTSRHKTGQPRKTRAADVRTHKNSTNMSCSKKLQLHKSTKFSSLMQDYVFLTGFCGSTKTGFVEPVLNSGE